MKKIKAPRRPLSPGIKLLLEMGPLLIFFAVNSRTDIFIATAVFMVAVGVSLAITWALVRALPVMPLVSGVIVLVFGGMTIYLQNDTFIKLKPTIINVLFGSILLGGLAFGKSFLKLMFEDAFSLNREGWAKLTVRWALFFFFLAILNEIVWRYFSTDAWVAFKVWGVFPLTIAFALLQMPLLTRYPATDDPADSQTGIINLDEERASELDAPTPGR